MKLVQSREHLISTGGVDGLLLYHQGISSHSAEYAFFVS